MQVILYKNTADPRKVNKLLDMVQIKTVNARPYYPMSITAPVLKFKYDNNLTDINYCYIPELSRYYFINNITLDSGDTMILTCEVDVLMSFRADILNLDAICLRNQHDFNPYIEDDLPTTVKATTTNYIMFSETPFINPQGNTDCYAMTVNSLVGS